MVFLHLAGLKPDTDKAFAVKRRSPHRAACRRKLCHTWVLPHQIYSRAAILDALLTRHRPRQLHQGLVVRLDAVEAHLLVV